MFARDGSPKTRAVACLTLALAVLGTLCVLFNPYLWFDEAGQFFISQGQTHWSAPFTQPQGFRAIVEQNNRYLFDPLGFTLLLRIWMAAGTNATWLRTLPFAAFLGMLWVAYSLLRQLGLSKTTALLATALLPSSPILHQYAGELRPYSFEALTALAIPLVLFRWQPLDNAGKAFRSGCVVAVLLWFRYPSVLCAGVAGVLLFLECLRTSDSRRWKNLSIYVTPQALSAALVYWFCIRHQPITPQAPCYAMASTLKYHAGYLLHPWSMMYHVMLIGFLTVLMFARRRTPRFYKVALPYGKYVVGLTAAYWLVSAIGRMPSDPASRWGIGLTVSYMVCGALTLGYILQFLQRSLRAPIAVAIILIALYRPTLQTIRWATGNFRFGERAKVAEILRYTAATTSPVVCGSGSTPEIRYLFEWGSLQTKRKTCRYPSNFLLLNQQNEQPFLMSLPVGTTIFWADNPGTKYLYGGKFQSQQVPGSSYFHTLTRVQE